MDFTYFITLDKNEDTLIKSIRVVKEQEHYVFTVYYYYQSIIFGEKKENIIFNWNYDHKLEYHQKDEPFDWHIHIKVKTKEDLLQKIKTLEKYGILKKDAANIKKILNSETKLKLSNVQYDGTRNTKMYDKLKKIMKKEKYDFEILKNDVLNEKYLFLIFYFLRFSGLEFKITDDLLNALNKDNININFADEAFEEYTKIIVAAFNDYSTKKRKVSLRYYMDLRLTVELAWNIIKAKNETDKTIAYFLYYKRFQNCLTEKHKECQINFNLKDKLFENMLTRVKRKIKIANNEMVDFDNSHIFNNDKYENNNAMGKVVETGANVNFDGGDPGVIGNIT